MSNLKKKKKKHHDKVIKYLNPVKEECENVKNTRQ